MDGTFTFREKGQSRYSSSLPVFSVDTKKEALDLQLLFCRKTYEPSVVIALQKELGMPLVDPGPSRHIFHYPPDSQNPLGRKFGQTTLEFKEIADILHKEWRGE